MWIVDFGVRTTLDEAALYEAPFEFVVAHVKPVRDLNRRAGRAARWWIHSEAAPAMRDALAGLARFIASPITSKHRLFVWLSSEVLATNTVSVIARDDDYTFGVLHSRVHEAWALAQGTQLETRPRYTPTTCFETFPFPHPTQAQRNAIAEAARELDRLRNGWLNPVGLSDADLAERSLTNLYNARPTWLAQLHERLDAAVLAAYGWPADLPTDELLARMLDLNLERAAAE